MSELWDRPPLPHLGDQSDNSTYEAVGRALSAWEAAEVALAQLYGVLLGNGSFEPSGPRQYGGPRIFDQRMDGLEKLAGKYFVFHPDQQKEHEFERIACKFRKFSFRRNDIAHGIVRELQFRGRKGYCLLPPLYDGRRFSGGNFPDFIYVADEINKFAAHFTTIRLEVGKFTNWLVPLP
jgi:hypothetical protein